MKKLFTLLMVCSFFAVTAQTALNPGAILTINGNAVANRSAVFGAVLDLDTPFCGDVVLVDSKGNTVPPYTAGQVATPITKAEGCDEVLNAADLKGKIALIRRGTCPFVEKAINAQNAGAIGVVIYNRVDPDNANGPIVLGGTDPNITIPCFMISLENGESIITDLKANKKVEICVVRPSRLSKILVGPQTSTPLAHRDTIRPFFEFENRSGIDDLNKKMYVEITSPSNKKTVFERTLDSIPTLPDGTVGFSPVMGAYYPAELGAYKVRAFGEYTPKDTLHNTFIINDKKTFALDNGTHISTGNGLGQSKASFGMEGQQWHHLSFFQTSSVAEKATFATFGLGNGPATTKMTDFTGRDIEIAIAKVDIDVVTDPAFVLSDVTEVAAMATFKGDTYYYKIKGTETVGNLITVPLKDGNKAIDLDANSVYLVDLFYDNTTKSDSLMPGFAGYLDNPVRIIQNGDVLPTDGAQILTPNNYYSGYSGNSQALIRLHTDGFMINDKNLTFLKEEEIKFFPNPTTNVVNLQMNLIDNAKYVKLGIMDITGKVLEVQDINITNGNVSVSLASYPSGTYFFTVKTDKSFRTEKIVKF